MDTWKDIPNYEGFQINLSQQVRRLAHSYTDVKGRVMHQQEKLITINKSQKGYLRCALCLGNGQRKHFTIHRLMMLTFIGLPPDGMDQINHKDGDKANNNINNLEWSNNSLNIKHAWATGLFNPALPKGLMFGRAKQLVHKEYGFFCNIIEAARISDLDRIKMGQMIAGKIPNTTKFIAA